MFHNTPDGSAQVEVGKQVERRRAGDFAIDFGDEQVVVRARQDLREHLPLALAQRFQGTSAARAPCRELLVEGEDPRQIAFSSFAYDCLRCIDHRLLLFLLKEVGRKAWREGSL